MKAAIVVQPGQLTIQEISRPTPGPYEALVQIEACGLCGTTDRHLVDGVQAHHPASWYPAILGHESVGSVIAVGKYVSKFKVGDRVTRPVALWPGTQGELYSAWGGFAEYGLVRDNTVDGGPDPEYTNMRQNVVPPELSLTDAVMALSIAEVASWMEKLGNLRDKVIVIGGTGFAACVMCQCAVAAGARQVIAFGRNESKFLWVQRNGATNFLILDESLQQKIRALTRGGADWFLDAVGHQSVFEAGLRCLKPGGAAAIYGAPAGFSYQLPLSIVGGDFAVHYLAPNDDTYFHQACRRIISGELNTETIHTHCWQGLESLPEALKEQAAGEVLKGYVRIQ